LTPLGRELGVVDDMRWAAYEQRAVMIETLRDRFDRTFVNGRSLREIARRPDVSVDQIESALNGTFDRSIIERVIIEAKYDGYIARQQAEIRRQAQIDNQLIPDWIEYETISGLRAEAIESLRTF